MIMASCLESKEENNVESTSSLEENDKNIVESTSSLEDKEENNTESVEEIRLVLIGKIGTGKSATGNSILGERHFESKCLPTSVTKTCSRKTTTILGKKVVVVDTPGFFDPDAADEVTEEEITRLFTLTSPGPHAVILVSEIKRFCEDDQKAVDKFSQIFGESVIDFVIVLFTGSDDLKNTNERFEDFINCLPAEQIKFLSKCENRYLDFDNTSDHKSQDAERLIKMVEQLIQTNEGESYRHELYMATEIQILSKISQIQKEKETEYDTFRKNMKDAILNQYKNLRKETVQRNVAIKKELEKIQKQRNSKKETGLKARRSRENQELNDLLRAEETKEITSRQGSRRAHDEMKTAESIQNQDNPNDETGKTAKIRKTEETVVSIQQSERVERKKIITKLKRHEVEAMKDQLKILQGEQQLRHEMNENKLKILDLEEQKHKELHSILRELDNSYMQSVQTSKLREKLCHEDVENETLIDELIALSKQNTSPSHLMAKLKSHTTAANMI